MAAVAGLGFEPVACPMLELYAPPGDRPQQARVLQAILVTSRQALTWLAGGAEHDPALRQLPLFAVGDRTADCAREAGFTNVTSAGGDAKDLLALVRAKRPAGDALLFPTARGQGAWLANSLRDAGYTVHFHWVYSATRPRDMPAAGLAALEAGNLAAALYFSTETARNFAILCPVRLHPRLGAVRALAISPSVAGALAGMPWHSVEIAERADADAMLSLLLRHDITQGNHP